MKNCLHFKTLTFLSLCLCLLFSTGCSGNVSLYGNYRAIDSLRLVHTLGFDTHRQGLELSVSGGEKENQGLLRMSAPGANITRAADVLQQFSGKEELYYAHTRYVLVGEDYAQEGLEPVMNYLESSAQLRTDLPMFLVKDGTAKELLLKAGGKEHSIFEMLESVLRECTRSGDSYPFTCGDIAVYSAEYGSALICALNVQHTKDFDPAAEDDQLTPVVAGYGVLKEGKLVGYISENAARGVNLLLNELGTGTVTLMLDRKPVSLQIIKADTTLVPEFGEAGTITHLRVDMALEATVEEAIDRETMDMEQVGQVLSTQVELWLGSILQTMHNTQADFLGFGPQIAMHFPKQWARCPVDWLTQLKTLPMDARVQCRVSPGENAPRR